MGLKDPSFCSDCQIPRNIQPCFVFSLPLPWPASCRVSVPLVEQQWLQHQQLCQQVVVEVVAAGEDVVVEDVEDVEVAVDVDVAVLLAPPAHSQLQCAPLA